MTFYKKSDIKKLDIVVDDIEIKEEVRKIEEKTLRINTNQDFNIKYIHKLILKKISGNKKKLDLYNKEIKGIMEDAEISRTIDEKKDIMVRYLEIAKYYIDITYNVDTKRKNICISCGEIDPLEICHMCGAINIKPISLSPKIRNDKMEKLKSLEKMIDEYEGKKPISEKDKEKLEKLLKKNMDRSQVIKALELNKLSTLKKNINRIMFEYYGESLISLDHVRENIKYKYMRILEVFDEIKPETRSNSLIKSLVFHYLLRTENMSAKNVELLKTVDSRMEQTKILENIFFILSIREPDYNWSFETEDL